MQGNSVPTSSYNSFSSIDSDKSMRVRTSGSEGKGGHRQRQDQPPMRRYSRHDSRQSTSSTSSITGRGQGS